MTDPLTGLRAEMAAYLRESPLFEGIAVREEFPGGYKGVPTRQACVTVGISGVERAAAPGGRVKLTLRFDILCPPGGNPGCHSLFDRLCGALFPEERVRRGGNPLRGRRVRPGDRLPRADRRGGPRGAAPSE